jgi:hypothetical protein
VVRTPLAQGDLCFSDIDKINARTGKSDFVDRSMGVIVLSRSVP